MMNG